MSPRSTNFARRLAAGLTLALARAAAVTLVIAGLGCERGAIGVEATPVTIESETVGHGRAATPGTVVCMDWSVEHLDGTLVLTDTDTCFVVGEQNVIEGLQDTIAGMKGGGRRTVVLPPHKHWGRQGHGPIPPMTNLRLHVSVTAVHPEGWERHDR